MRSESIDPRTEKVRNLIETWNRKQKWGMQEASYLAALRDIPFLGTPAVVYFSKIHDVLDSMEKSLRKSMETLNHAILKEMQPLKKEIDALRTAELKARFAEIVREVTSASATSITPSLPPHPERHFLKAVKEEDLAKIDELIKAGFPIETVIADKKRRALHIACEETKVKSVQKLIALGANVNAEAIMGFRPLHIAAQQGDSQVMTALLKAGASLEARTEDGKGSTALHEAIWHGMPSSVKFLVAAGADSNAYRLTATGELVSPVMLAQLSARTGLLMPLVAIISALIGPDQTFFNQVQRLIYQWDTKYKAKNKQEKNYISQLKAIPHLAGKTEEYALNLKAALDKDFEAVKENMKPMRLAIMKCIDDYNKDKTFIIKIRTQISPESRKADMAAPAITGAGDSSSPTCSYS